jgi:hypothetical protein
VKLRLSIVVVVLFLLILILPFFVSQVESSTNTYYPSNYNLSGSTQLVSGSLANLTSDDGNYMTFRSYSSYDFKYAESLGESSWNTDTNYQDKVVLTFTPSVSADYIVIATAEVQGNCISPPDVKARLYIGTSTYQELIYRIKDTTDWYPFCALKRVNLPASSQTLKIQYAISATTATAKIRNARLCVFSLSSHYAESEAESSWNTDTSWQDKVALTFTPSTSGDYLIIATANLGGSSTQYSTLVQFLKDGIVQAGPTRETSASEARYTFGVMRKINLDATSHEFKIQYKTEHTLNTAYISYAHIVAIRLDQFSNNYYAESEGESGPASSNTWYDKVTNTYTAEAADHLIIGSILYKAGSTYSSVGVRLVQGADIDQSLLVEHKDSTDYEGCFMMAKASLSEGSVTDKIRYKGESTSARVKNARLISLQLPIQQMVEVEFTGSSNTDDWTQLNWVVDSAWTTPSVTVTLQLYDFNLGQYPTSGDGYVSYTSSATSNTDETKSQTISTNPTHFRDGSGNWKIKVKGIKSTTTQFDFKADLIKLEVTYTPPIVQYYLTVDTDPEGIVSISGEGWYDNCTYVNLAAPLFVPDEAGAGGERYRFSNWTVDGDFISGNPITVYMDANHAAAAHYVKQYKLIMSTNFGTTSPSVGSYWHDVGSVVPISATAPSVIDGEQYVWLGWTGTGTISYTGTANPSSVTMDSPITETAAWRHEYRLTMVTNFGTTSPSVGTHWYEAETVVPIQAFAPSVVDGEQYVWLGWTGAGTISYTGMNNPASVTMNSPITETASWRHEYRLTMATNYGTTSPSLGDHWYEAGSIVAIGATPPSTIDGEQYVWNGWTGAGIISYTGMDNSAAVTMNSPITQTASWIHQYRLTMATNFGTTDPSVGVHWYDAGSVVSIEATAPSVVDGEQYVWLGWTGTGIISYSGMDNPASVTMDSPITETAAWRHEYRLTMATNYGTTSPSAGVHWYEVGTVVPIQAFAPSVITGEQYVWNGWTGTGTISYTGTANPSSVTMDSPISETVSWTHQFLLTINTGGLPSAYPTNVYLAGSQVGTASDASPYTKWFDAGTSTGTIGVDNTVSGATGTRYVFAKWVEDSSTNNPRASETMDSPKTFTAEYKTQYKVSFTQTGSGVAPTVTYIAETDPIETVPFDDWVKAGSVITYAYQDTVLGAPGVRYVLISVSPPSSQTVNNPLTIIGSYKTQYQITVTASPSGALGGTFKVTYTQCGTTFTNVQKTTSWTEWADGTTTVTLSDPQDIVNGYKFDSYNPSATVTMNQAKTITLVYTVIPPFSVSISPTSAKIKVGESVTFTSAVSGGVPGYSYKWYLNGTEVSGAISPTWTFAPVTSGTYNVYLNVTDSIHNTAKSNTASVTVEPPLQVSISPTSASILVGQSVTFTSSVSGGYSPYSYQWYLGGVQVSGATSSTWTFTPTASGIYYVYLQVKDDNDNIAQSETAKITVIPSAPVGGYSVSLAKRTPTSQIAAYTLLIALFGAALSLRKRKRK